MNGDRCFLPLEPVHRANPRFALLPLLQAVDLNVVRGGHQDVITLDSYALDVWFDISLDLKASPGLFYYQSDDLDEVNGSDLLNRLSC
jgi:hypothetical protein